MKLVIITLEQGPEDEVQTIKELVSGGIIVHLRKKSWSKEQWLGFIQQFSAEEKKKMTLHGTLDLASELGVGGIHFADGQEVVLSNLRTSQSLHAPEKLKSKNQLDYALISPVYDSISKEGYKANVDLHAFNELVANNEIKCPVYALGGITTEKLNELASYGFQGAALCGAFWSQPRQQRLNQLGL